MTTPRSICLRKISNLLVVVVKLCNILVKTIGVENLKYTLSILFLDKTAREKVMHKFSGKKYVTEILIEITNTVISLFFSNFPCNPTKLLSSSSLANITIFDFFSFV